MSTRMKLTRRTALAGLAAATGLAAVAPSPAGAFALPERAGDRDLADRALRMFSRPNDARRVGFACQGHADLCGPREVLVDTIFGAERDRLAGSADAEIHAWLRGRIRRDFAEGRTVKVEGWVLAETEARLYALAAYA